MPSMLEAIRKAKRPVALTGAGISAPSGVPTFQTQWKGRPVRDFLGRDYFTRDPLGFFELYCMMEAWRRAEPNEAHLALARMKVPVITQNIDGLHQKAGSETVLELHGNLRNILCPECKKTLSAQAFCGAVRPLYEAGKTEAVWESLHCECGAMLDVDVVLYGDAVRHMEEAARLVRQCDLLLVIGTSLGTYPAAALPDIARQRGTRVIIEDQDCVKALTEQEIE